MSPKPVKKNKGTLLHLLKVLTLLTVSIILMISINACSNKNRNTSEIPHLQKHGNTVQLIVDGKPFLMLAGELGNSSASNLDYMRTIWSKLVKMHLNTVLVPVYWELLEPQEGKFDFTLVDSIIYSAKQNNLKLVFLWFGTWKNSMSCYVPYWVKTDQKRFPRARTKDGKSVEILSPFSDENLKADIKAFSTLMNHIGTIDKNQTVLMVQVENEIGMIPDARDYSEEANKLFNEYVPGELMNYLLEKKDNLNPELYKLWKENGLKKSGTWEEVFGKGLSTDEIFMAWYFGKYANSVAEAGKKEYPLPMYVNAALNRPNSKPGQYPSAGPLPHLMDVWKAAAPQIDLLAPDIYFKNFSDWLTKYVKPGNPLFIPEAANNQSIANAYLAIGQYNALGYSPFSIESMANPDDNQVAKGYKTLKELTPLIFENQGKGTMAGVLLDSVNQKVSVHLGDYVFNFKHEYSWPYAEKTGDGIPRVGGLIIKLATDEFVIAGSGLIVTFESNLNDGSIAGIGSIDEANYNDGKWVYGRRLNGDQDHQGRHMQLPNTAFSIQKVKLYKYK